MGTSVDVLYTAIDSLTNAYRVLRAAREARHPLTPVQRDAIGRILGAVGGIPEVAGRRLTPEQASRCGVDLVRSIEAEDRGMTELEDAVIEEAHRTRRP